MEEESNTIDRWLKLFLTYGQPDLWPSSIDVGQTDLRDEYPFLGAFFNFVASESEAWESYENFIELQKRPCRAPNKDDVKLVEEARGIAQKIPDVLGDKVISKSQKMVLAKAVVFKKEQQKYLTLRSEMDELKTFSSDIDGYAKWVVSQMNEKDKQTLFSPKSFKILETFRYKHTYVSGGSGSGKSETMKRILHHYLTTDTETSVVVLDPHGAFAKDVAQFQENAHSDRLVFLSSDFDKELSPVLNPFDIHKSDDIELRKEEILNALVAVLGEEASMTKQMIALLSPCITTLLHLPDTTIDHLKQFMDDRQNETLKREALKCLTNPTDIDFMRSDFDNSSYAPTKQSIRTRLHILLTASTFRNFLVGKSTVGLRKVIAEKKLIVFSFTNTGGNDSASLALGRLVLAQLLSVAMERGKDEELCENASPIHLFIDEAHNFAVPSMMKILAEARKYKLYLTLANQFIGQFPNSGTCALRPEVQKNTYLKLTGFQPAATDAVAMANLVGTTPEYLSSLPVGKFHVKIGELPGFPVQNGIELVGSNHAMSPEQWTNISTTQKSRYYRTIPSKEQAMKEYLYKPKVASNPKPKRSL